MSLHDDYLATLPGDQSTALTRVRALIKQTAPDTEEVIGYGMPVFKYRGKYLIGYCAFKQHMSIFPGAEAIADLQTDLRKYKTAKGTIQFTIEQPLPDSLITKVVKHRLQAIESSNK